MAQSSSGKIAGTQETAGLDFFQTAEQ